MSDHQPPSRPPDTAAAIQRSYADIFSAAGTQSHLDLWKAVIQLQQQRELEIPPIKLAIVKSDLQHSLLVARLDSTERKLREIARSKLVNRSRFWLWLKHTATIGVPVGLSYTTGFAHDVLEAVRTLLH